MLAGIFRRHILIAHKMSCLSAAASARVSDASYGSCPLWPCRGSSARLLPKISDAVGLGQLRTQYFHSSAARLKKRQQPEPPPRELDLLRYDMRDLGKSPKPALYLGLSGLIPFISAPFVMAVTETYLPEVAFAQVAYGASILSFLGGARWGFAIPETSPAKPDWINLANSVVPSLFAWLAMLFSDTITPAAMMVIMGLGISLHYDLSLLPTYPSWFKALRTILSVVAFLSLVATLVLKGVYPEKKIFSEQ
ncbi:transmembrane protein 69 isoform X2 [Coregonus clupeaformis]|uniref:transmembrane protein 69 isoform X2 n=1 Tax=Coregonus clupeaformis TaxID=59861 RepID=UPI001BE03AFA|nr:transmembrane protein 69 isoform X2 [Coregonus clupeaformis]